MSLIIINFALVLSVILQINQKSRIQVTTLPNVVGRNIDEKINLDWFDVEINYVEDDSSKGQIIATTPMPNSVVHLGQKIILNVSKGYVSEKYKDITNTLYSDNKAYLEYLSSNYQIKIIENYLYDSKKIDGLILDIDLKGEIHPNDQLTITIARNPKTVVMPDFTGCYYQEAMAFANKNGIQVKFYYVEGFIATDFIVGQSIKPGTSVLKNGCYLEIYLQE